MDSSDWIAVASGVLSLLAILVSVLVARSQLGLARREQLFAVTSELLAEFRTADFKDRLTYVQKSLAADSPRADDGSLAMSEVSWRTARPVMSYFNNMGLLVFHGSISAELASSIMGGSVISAWKALGPYIYAQRERRDDDPNYYGYFEHLAAVVAEIGPQRLGSMLNLRKLPPAEAQKML